MSNKIKVVIASTMVHHTPAQIMALEHYHQHKCASQTKANKSDRKRNRKDRWK